MSKRTTTNLSLSVPYRKFYKSIIEPERNPDGTAAPYQDQFGFASDGVDVPYEMASPTFRKIPASAFNRNSADKSTIEFSYRVPSFKNIDDVSTNELNSASQRMADFILGLPTAYEDVVDAIWFYYSLEPQLTEQQFEDKYFSTKDADNNIMVAPLINSYRAIFGDDDDTQKLRDTLKKNGLPSSILGSAKGDGSKMSSIKDALAGMIDMINRTSNGNASVSTVFLSLQAMHAMVSTPMSQQYKEHINPGVDLRTFIHQEVLGLKIPTATGEIELIAALGNRTAFKTLPKAIAKMKAVLKANKPQSGNLSAVEKNAKEEIRKILTGNDQDIKAGDAIFKIFKSYKYWAYIKIHVEITRMKSEYFNQYKYIRIEEQKASGADRFITKTTTFDQFQITIKNNDVAIMMDGHEKPVIQNMGGSANSIVLSILTNDMQILDAIVELGIDANLFRRQENIIYNAYSIKSKGRSSASTERFKQNFDNYVQDLISKATGFDPNKIFDEPILINSTMTQIGRIYGCTIDRMEFENVDTAVNTWRINMYMSGMDLSQKDREVLKRVTYTASSYEHDLYLSEYMSPYGLMRAEDEHNRTKTNASDELAALSEDSDIQISKIKAMGSMSIDAIVEDLLFMTTLAYPYLRYRVGKGEVSHTDIVSELSSLTRQIKVEEQVEDSTRLAVNILAPTAGVLAGLVTMFTGPIGSALIGGAVTAAIYSKFGPGSHNSPTIVNNITEMQDVLAIFDMALLMLLTTYYGRTIEPNRNFALTIEDLVGFLNTLANDQHGPKEIQINVASNITSTESSSRDYKGMDASIGEWYKDNFAFNKDNKRLLFYETFGHIFTRQTRLINRQVPKDFGDKVFSITFPKSDIDHLIGGFNQALRAGGIKLIGEMLFHMLSFLFPGKDGNVNGSTDLRNLIKKTGRGEASDDYSSISRLSAVTSEPNSTRVGAIRKEAVKMYTDLIVNPSTSNTFINHTLHKIDGKPDRIFNGSKSSPVDVTEQVQEAKLKFREYLVSDSSGVLEVSINRTLDAELDPVSGDKVDTANGKFKVSEIMKSLRLVNFLEAGSGLNETLSFIKEARDRYKTPNYNATLNSNDDAGSSSSYIHLTSEGFSGFPTKADNVSALLSSSFTVSDTESQFLSMNASTRRTVFDARIKDALSGLLDSSSTVRLGYAALIKNIYWSKGVKRSSGAFTTDANILRWPAKLGWETLLCLCPFMLIAKTDRLSTGSINGAAIFRPLDLENATWNANLKEAVTILGTVVNNAGDGIPEVGLLDSIDGAFQTFAKYINGCLQMPGFSIDLKLDGSNVVVDGINIELHNKPVSNDNYFDVKTNDTYARASLTPVGSKSLLELAPQYQPSTAHQRHFLKNTLSGATDDYSSSIARQLLPIVPYIYVVVYKSGATDKDPANIDFITEGQTFWKVADQVKGRMIGLLLLKRHGSVASATAEEDRFIYGKLGTLTDPSGYNPDNFYKYTEKVKAKDPSGTTIIRGAGSYGSSNSGLLPLIEGWVFSIPLVTVAYTRMLSLCGNHIGNIQGPDSLCIFPAKPTDPVFDRYVIQHSNCSSIDEGGSSYTTFFAGKVVDNQIVNRITGQEARNIIKRFVVSNTKGLADPCVYFMIETLKAISDAAKSIDVNTNATVKKFVRSGNPATLFTGLITGAISPLVLYAIVALKVRNGNGYDTLNAFSSSLLTDPNSVLENIYCMTWNQIKSCIANNKIDIPKAPNNRQYRFLKGVQNAHQIMNADGGGRIQIINGSVLANTNADHKRFMNIGALGIGSLYPLLTGLTETSSANPNPAPPPPAPVVVTNKVAQSTFYGNKAMWLTAISEMYNHHERKTNTSTFPEPSEVFMGIKLDFSMALMSSLIKGLTSHIQSFTSPDAPALMTKAEIQPVVIDWRQTNGGYVSMFSFYGRPESLIKLLNIPKPGVKFDVGAASGFGVGAAIRLLPGGIGTAYRDMVDASLTSVVGFDKYASEHYSRFFAPAIAAPIGSQTRKDLITRLGSQYASVLGRSLLRWKMLLRMNATSMLANDVGDTQTAYPDLPLPAIWKPGRFKDLMADVPDNLFWERAAALYPEITEVVFADVQSRFKTGEKYTRRESVEAIFDDHLGEVNYLVTPNFYIENPFEIRASALNDITNFFKSAQDTLGSQNGDADLGPEVKRKLALESLSRAERDILTQIQQEVAAKVPAGKAFEIMKDLDLNLGTLALLSSAAGRQEIAEYNEYLALIENDDPSKKTQVEAAQRANIKLSEKFTDFVNGK